MGSSLASNYVAKDDLELLILMPCFYLYMDVINKVSSFTSVSTAVSPAQLVLIQQWERCVIYCSSPKFQDNCVTV